MGKATLFLLLCVSVSVGQVYSPWGKVDTVTSGDFDDFNPVLDRGSVQSVFAAPYAQWLTFERQTDSASMIVAKRFLNSLASWDTTDFVISVGPTTFPRSNPDICSNPLSSSQSGYVLAAWEISGNSHTGIYFSYIDGSNATWSGPILLYADTLRNTTPHVYYWYDGSGSKFAIVWRHENALVYSLISPPSFSPPDTIVASNLDDFDYDIISLDRRFTNPGNALVWTLRGNDGYRTLAATSLQIDSTVRITDADSLSLGRDIYSPHIMDTTPWFYDSEIAFTTSHNSTQQTHWVLWNSGTAVLSGEQSLFPADLNSNINFQEWYRTIIVDQYPPPMNQDTAILLQGFSVRENISQTDTALIFSATGSIVPNWQPVSFIDTIRTVGSNRNPHFGTYSFQLFDKPANMVVWESSRTGRSHIYSRGFVWTGIDAVNEDTPGPTTFELCQNYPNPFNPSTTISYRLSAVSRVDITVYDLLGRKVKTLVDARQTPGEHSVTFDSRGLASGVYFYRLSAGSYVTVKKMLLLK